MDKTKSRLFLSVCFISTYTGSDSQIIYFQDIFAQQEITDRRVHNIKSMKIVSPSYLISWKTSISDMDRKCILPNMISAEPHLSYLVKMHFRKGVLYEKKCEGMTSFMDDNIIQNKIIKEV